MFGDRDETPSRSELLSMVKKHSNLLGKTIVEEQDALDVEMDSGFWHDVFDLYFIRGKESRGRQDDDLLFFVRKMGLHGYGFNDNAEDVTPYFVRRWTPKLDDLLGKNLTEVDWRRSFYLNMIAHTAFSVTVAICSHQVLRNRQAGTDAALSPIYKVVKTVYASPSRVNFQLDSKKEVETKPAYPDICFAVDDFDSTFDAVVLSDTDHCYCVLLNAEDGAAFPIENESYDSSSSNSSPPKIVMDSGKAKNAKLTLFSGFVSYQMVREAYDAGKSRFGSLLSLGHSLGKTDRLYMKGPGGRGEVEVAVSGVADQSQQDLGPFSPVVSKKGFAIGSIVRKAASVASVAAKQAYAAAAATTTDEEMLPLKCCLMSISLPWEHIAYDLLFKLVDNAKNYVPDKVTNMRKPEASLSKIGLKGVSREGVDYMADVSIDNPYSHSIPICEISYVLKSDDRVIASGNIPDPGSLKGSDKIVLNVPVKVPHSVLVSLVRDIARDWDIDYLLELGLVIDLSVIGNFTIPLSS